MDEQQKPNIWDDKDQEHPGSPQADQPLPLAPPKPKMSSKLWLVIGLVVLLLAVGGTVAWYLMGNKSDKNSGDKTSNGSKTKLVVMSHWLEAPQIEGIKDADGKVLSKGFQAYLDEYQQQNQNIEIQLLQVHFNDYPNRLRVLADSGAAPDIY